MQVAHAITQGNTHPDSKAEEKIGDGDNEIPPSDKPALVLPEYLVLGEPVNHNTTRKANPLPVTCPAVTAVMHFTCTCNGRASLHSRHAHAPGDELRFVREKANGVGVENLTLLDVRLLRSLCSGLANGDAGLD